MQLLGIATTVIVLGPALAASTNHDPAAAISFLITIKLLRSTHLRGVQPVRTTLSLRIILLNLPTAGCGSLARRTVIVTCISGLRTRSNRAQRSRNHRKRSNRRTQSTGTSTRSYARTLRSGRSSALRTPSTRERKKIHYVSPRDLNRHTAENANHTVPPTQHKAQHSNQVSGERSSMKSTNSESVAGISECSYRKLNEYAPPSHARSQQRQRITRSGTLKICEASPTVPTAKKHHRQRFSPSSKRTEATYPTQ
ncbi:Uncharacterised protein [Mycobacterium tuberculosis]|nr:Uncharacterised protein [Mycobacterium tuberculosis]